MAGYCRPCTRVRGNFDASTWPTLYISMTTYPRTETALVTENIWPKCVSHHPLPASLTLSSINIFVTVQSLSWLHDQTTLKNLRYSTSSSFKKRQASTATLDKNVPLIDTSGSFHTHKDKALCLRKTSTQFLLSGLKHYIRKKRWTSFRAPRHKTTAQRDDLLVTAREPIFHLVVHAPAYCYDTNYSLC